MIFNPAPSLPHAQFRRHLDLPPFRPLQYPEIALNPQSILLAALAVAMVTADRYAVYGLVGVALIIVLRHRANIRRLLARQGG